MKRKIRLGLLFGGRSAEHEVSLLSARNIFQALDRSKYDIVLIGIDPEGRWCVRNEAVFLLSSAKSSGALPALGAATDLVTLIPSSGGRNLVGVAENTVAESVDVVFPVLHGTYGEDGTMQGLLKLANIPFVGPGVLGSAVSMDKDVMKRLFRDAGIPSAKFIAVQASERAQLDFERVTAELGRPVFIKPANLGSSVGVSKAENRQQFEAAVADAFQYDRKILIEEFIKGRELECAVLGNEQVLASGVGEIIPDARHGFYSYDAKYIDEKGAQIRIPADIPVQVAERVRELAVQAFKVLCCEGLARVDVFLRGEEVLLNEINTIPGFTSISMYPKLWEHSGIPYSELIDRLIGLALERFEAESRLKTKVS